IAAVGHRHRAGPRALRMARHRTAAPRLLRHARRLRHPPVTMLRIAIVADYAEEGWPSMDLVADMLLDRLRREHADTIDAALIRPTMPRRVTHLPLVSGKMAMLDRAIARQWDYPR